MSKYNTFSISDKKNFYYEIRDLPTIRKTLQEYGPQYCRELFAKTYSREGSTPYTRIWDILSRQYKTLTGESISEQDDSAQNLRIAELGQILDEMFIQSNACVNEAHRKMFTEDADLMAFYILCLFDESRL